jgi:hypothetical protein
MRKICGMGFAKIGKQLSEIGSGLSSTLGAPFPPPNNFIGFMTAKHNKNYLSIPISFFTIISHHHRDIDQLPCRLLFTYWPITRVATCFINRVLQAK